MMTIITKATCTSSKRPPRNGHEKPLDPSRHCTFERASAASDDDYDHDGDGDGNDGDDQNMF